MQDSACQDTLFSCLSFDRSPISFVSRIYPVYDSHDFVYPCDLSADRRLDVSFDLDGLVGNSRVMMGWDFLGIPGWGLLADFSVEHACVLTDDGDFRWFTDDAKPLRCARSA